MNNLEKQMIDLLTELKELYGAISVRAEFEAEGTRLDELLRLKEISLTAGMELMLKIGGCESVRDMLETRVVGVNAIVAPMVESPYALRKYLQAVIKVFPHDELEKIKVFCNIETSTACRNFPQMLEIPEIKVLSGIVVERTDLCFSLGKTGAFVNHRQIGQMVSEIMVRAKKRGLICVIGGGITAQARSFFNDLPDGCLDQYETRKICFTYAKSSPEKLKKGILKALEFEVCWIKNKASFYKGIDLFDNRRLGILKQRYLQESRSKY